jgi:hypothetical protein
MSESSLPSLGPAKFRLLLTTIRLPRWQEVLRRLYSRGRPHTRKTVGAQAEPALESRATRAIREYLDRHTTNLERAARLEKKAERLEKAGIPSESARNRAERARGEVVAGLAALRVSFVEATGGREGAYAFDRVVELLCPTFMLHRPSAGRI